MIPRVAHFVFGLEEQHEPFHFTQYLSIESCRRVLAPDVIYFHHKHLPWGTWWDRVRPHLTLREVDLVPEVTEADYSMGTVPGSFRYAHHADFIRLDALIETGGIYADIDTVFVRPFPAELFDRPFVIGAEAPVRDEQTGELRPSLCNALLMAEPGSRFARAWRDRMAGALNGTWSNHSGFLSQTLSEQLPSDVHVEAESTFFPFPPTPAGLAELFEERHSLPAAALSVHLWAHLWWQRGRRDYSIAHSGWCTPPALRTARTTFADLARPYLAGSEPGDGPAQGTGRATAITAGGGESWSYLSLDEVSGYGTAAERCMAALEGSGLEVNWTPMVPGNGWGLGYQPPPALDLPEPLDPGHVVVAHLVAEYLPVLRRRCPEAFLVGHTVWDTSRIPEHWAGCLAEADLVVVPSRFSAEAVAASSSKTPIAVVPHVAPEPRPGRSRLWDVPPDVFVFYTIAEWTERKAVFHSVEAYLRAFTGRDPVRLVVKTSHRDWRFGPPSGDRPVVEGTSAWSLARLLARHPDPPAVSLVTRGLTDDDIRGLHQRGNCFVSLCRGEGWGLGAFDAAAWGKPVVTTGFGGQLDYLDAAPYLVGFDLVPVDDPAGYPSYAPDQRWAEPNVDHGAELLRRVLGHREEADASAAAMGRNIRWRYRPAAMAGAFRSAVESHRDRVGGRRV